MSAEHREIPEPGELVYGPQPSWAPIFFGFAAALAVCGIFAGGFMFASYIWSIIGLVILLGALRVMVKGSIGDYFRLPRKQRVRSAVLPVEKISPPTD